MGRFRGLLWGWIFLCNGLVGDSGMNWDFVLGREGKGRGMFEFFHELWRWVMGCEGPWQGLLFWEFLVWRQ